MIRPAYNIFIAHQGAPVCILGVTDLNNHYELEFALRNCVYSLKMLGYIH